MQIIVVKVATVLTYLPLKIPGITVRQKHKSKETMFPLSSVD